MIERDGERDTHFRHAAKFLAERIEPYVSEWSWLNTEANSGKGDLPPLETLLARFSYDLVYHTFASMPIGYQDEYGDPPDCVKDIPDFSEWPGE